MNVGQRNFVIVIWPLESTDKSQNRVVVKSLGDSPKDKALGISRCGTMADLPEMLVECENVSSTRTQHSPNTDLQSMT